MCPQMRWLIARHYAGRTGSGNVDFLVVLGLFGLAAAIWYVQVGGGDGITDATSYLTARLRALSQIGR